MRRLSPDEIERWVTIRGNPVPIPNGVPRAPVFVRMREDKSVEDLKKMDNNKSKKKWAFPAGLGGYVGARKVTRKKKNVKKSEGGENMDIRKSLRYRVGLYQGQMAKGMGYAPEDVGRYLVSKSIAGEGFRSGYFQKRRKIGRIRINSRG